MIPDQDYFGDKRLSIIAMSILFESIMICLNNRNRVVLDVPQLESAIFNLNLELTVLRNREGPNGYNLTNLRITNVVNTACTGQSWLLFPGTSRVLAESMLLCIIHETGVIMRQNAQ